MKSIYRLATDDPHAFLFVKLRESNVNQILMKILEAEIHIHQNTYKDITP